ncbi:LysR substrate-binding domain-containing protein [Kitasatospora griseola]|uniref:LysR substrate-binding domain-containing protein n=1 Tax=Kitasatospora griseola TaxID=2064 RepID=UPI003823BC17
MGRPDALPRPPPRRRPRRPRRRRPGRRRPGLPAAHPLTPRPLETARVTVGEETFVAVASATLDTPGLPVGPCRLEDLSTCRRIVVAGPDDPVERRLLLSDDRWHVDSVEAALDLVHGGAGWANLPTSAIRAAVAAGRLRVLEFESTRNGVPCPCTWHGCAGTRCAGTRCAGPRERSSS